jgi:hypothetical protein
MMKDEQFAKRGNKKDTSWAIEQVRPDWPKARGRSRVERAKSR